MRPVKVLTMILAGGTGERLYPLTAHRSKPAVHFAGNFRIIDFTLMNCVLSGLRQIHVLTQYHSLSLGQHRSRRWHMLSPSLGEGIELVPPKMRTNEGHYRGTADAIYQNLDLLDAHRPDVVLVLSGDHVYRADYERLIRAHVDSDADITVLTGSVPTEEASSFGVVSLGERGRILEFAEKPDDPSPFEINGQCPINLGVYCFQTEFLIERLVRDSKEGTAHDFGKNILPGSLALGDVLSCPLAAVSPDDAPYWRDVGTIDSYFHAHMDLLGSPAKFDLRDARYSNDSCFTEWIPSLQTVTTQIAGKTISGKNLISGGVVIEDSRIVRCILSPNVRIGAGSELFESILFPGAEVGPDCRLNRVIVEEGVRVPAGTRIDATEDSHDFVVSENGVVVVSEGYRFVKPPQAADRRMSEASRRKTPSGRDTVRETGAPSNDRLEPFAHDRGEAATANDRQELDDAQRAVTKKARRAIAVTPRANAEAPQARTAT
jgi:glucose-1-phosphate adenylyltransferase